MTATTYKFKPWARLSGDAQKVGETLEELRATHGTLSPALVVSSARAADSILHDYFEWDNSAAAELYRHNQASHLIRSIVVVTTPGLDLQTPMRAFVSIRGAAEESDSEDGAAGSYTSITEAVRVVSYREQMIADALRDLEAYRQRYRMLTELTKWDAALERARAALAAAQEDEARKKKRSHPTPPERTPTKPQRNHEIRETP